jgi:hypothetical protein
MEVVKMTWVNEELSGLSLGDARLNQRACKLLASLSSHPEASIPRACGGAAEVRAAYRLIEREELDWRSLLQPHWESSRERMASEPVVLCLQDTTELDFLAKKKPPATPPGLSEVMRLVAQAGGFLGRKGDGHPGAKVLWLGMQALHLCAEGLRAGRAMAARGGYG